MSKKKAGPKEESTPQNKQPMFFFTHGTGGVGREKGGAKKDRSHERIQTRKTVHVNCCHIAISRHVRPAPILEGTGSKLGNEQYDKQNSPCGVRHSIIKIEQQQNQRAGPLTTRVQRKNRKNIHTYKTENISKPQID